MQEGLTKELAIRAIKLHKAMPKHLSFNCNIHLKNEKEVDVVRKLMEMEEFGLMENEDIIRTTMDKYFAVCFFKPTK